MSTVILRATARLLTPAILVFSLYLLVRGHDAPGGGFIAALVAGAAVALRFMSEGMTGARRVVPVSISVLLGTGLVLAVGIGFAGFVIGGELLEAGSIDLHPPLIGDLHLSSALVFDLGVYLIVLGLVLAVVEFLGGEERA